MTPKLADVLAGCIGFFYPVWKPADLKSEPQRGYIRLTDEGLIQIDTLEEDLLRSFAGNSNRSIPKWIIGQTQHGTVMLTDIIGFGSTVNIGGTRASVYRYRCQSMVFGIGAGMPKSPKLTKASVFLPDITTWAGLSAVDVQHDVGSNNRYKGISIKVEAVPPHAIKATKGRHLELGTHWEVSGSESRRTVYTPLQVTCSSSRPQYVYDLLEPIFYLQDLANIAYQGAIVGDGGRAEVPNSDVSRAPQFWNHALMFRLPSAIPPKSMTELPLFHLTDIDGINGVRRWVNLCARHPRAVNPVTRSFRLGPASPEVQMMDVAAGIEYWTAAHARTAKWSKVRPQSLAVAGRAGKAFSDWVGDADKWADQFWDEYNAIKHRPNQMLDPRRAILFAESGRILLTCVLLKRVALRNAIIEKILDSHRLNQLGEDTRKLVL